MMTTNEKCARMHTIFNSMKRLRFEISEIAGLGFKNGIYIIFEEGEEAHGGDRIVRVGTHKKHDRLQGRLNDHRNGSSIFRRTIGGAIMNKWNPSDPEMELWYRKKYKFINPIHYQKIRNAVSSHIINKTSFVAFAVEGIKKEERGTLFWEAKLIATIAQCNNCYPSENWLGNYVPTKFGNWDIVKTLGLWLSDETDSSVLSDVEFLELERLVETSKKKYS
jgi:hypothetical protein